MTINLALEYIPRRMFELGLGNNYHLRFRHFLLQPAEIRFIQSFNQMYLLVEEAADISVESDFGLYDLSYGLTNEMQYEHQGIITITNHSGLNNHVRFIQVIPNYNTNGNN